MRMIGQLSVNIVSNKERELRVRENHWTFVHTAYVGRNAVYKSVGFHSVMRQLHARIEILMIKTDIVLHMIALDHCPCGNMLPRPVEV